MLITISVIIGLSAAAAAVTGFGFNLVSVPLLTLAYPPRFVVVLTLLLGICASGLLLLRREIRREVEWRVVRPLYLSPLIALATGVSVTRCTPHPNAAVLFYEFMLRDGQEVLAKRDIVPTNLTVRPLPANMDITFMDPLQMLDNGPKWTELFASIFIKPH